MKTVCERSRLEGSRRTAVPKPFRESRQLQGERSAGYKTRCGRRQPGDKRTTAAVQTVDFYHVLKPPTKLDITAVLKIVRFFRWSAFFFQITRIARRSRAEGRSLSLG